MENRLKTQAEMGNPVVFFYKNCPLIILYAIILHLVWSVLFMGHPEISGVTGLRAIFPSISPNMKSAIFGSVSIMAIGGVFAIDWRLRTLLILPQQTVLCACAAGAITCMINGSFADGVIHPRAFIIADQMPSILAAIMHTLAIIKVSKSKNWGES